MLVGFVDGVEIINYVGGIGIAVTDVKCIMGHGVLSKIWAEGRDGRHYLGVSGEHTLSLSKAEESGVMRLVV